ncbi:hypothetical protein [Shewanella algicola]|uniref:hypothetical protein n=1 Tax=Shewanella algicola TaxID=640633 RepID=UPI0024940E95|nr:hypothetical protein [Shewanella algicola]
MNKFIVCLFILFLSACTTMPKPQVENNFKVEFGLIIEADGAYAINPNLKILSKDGIPLNQFGARVENLEKSSYSLGYYIFKFNNTTQTYEEFAVDGYWLIKPPSNSDYEAILFEDKKRFFPGAYQFVIIVEEEILQAIEFEVVDIDH